MDGGGMSGLTAEEAERTRYHLGYLGTSFGGQGVAASIQLGVARPVQTMFLVEEAIQNLLTNPYVVDRVRRVLQTLDNIEEKIRNSSTMLAVEQVGNIRLRGADAGKTYTDLLEREYKRWAFRLADILGVPIYPFSRRFSATGPGRSIPVKG